MRRGKEFSIETRNFGSKKEAVAFFRAMLNRYRPGDRVVENDANHLRALLKQHTEYTEKLGPGIAEFRVMENLYGTQSFQIIRVDGTSDDFSYLHCITPRK